GSRGGALAGGPVAVDARAHELRQAVEELPGPGLLVRVRLGVRVDQVEPDAPHEQVAQEAPLPPLGLARRLRHFPRFGLGGPLFRLFDLHGVRSVPKMTSCPFYSRSRRWPQKIQNPAVTPPV